MAPNRVGILLRPIWRLHGEAGDSHLQQIELLAPEHGLRPRVSDLLGREADGRPHPEQPLRHCQDLFDGRRELDDGGDQLRRSALSIGTVYAPPPARILVTSADVRGPQKRA